ncbi:HAD family hydrolase [Sedimenticola selenatireducens]|uniref:histidinol-phosphatase n=1 Tax=Sedimenticola selenatireducens TaxID=191960 RepID=UPI002AAC4CAC|nr:HAD family hydrolase [Sedimenticola selenatireducens]
MPLAIFDLDNTLLNGDSDHLWGQFLAEQGIVDGDWYERENDRFYQEYKEGTLDIHEFLRFSLKPLSQHSPEQLRQWHQAFMHEKIEPILLPAAQILIDKHRAAGDTLMIITATNAFVTAPIAAAFGIEHLIATDPEMVGGRYTGEVAGTPCFQEGKVTRLKQWLEQHRQNLAGSSFYSDSHNDLPLLRQVEHPIAVDPDETLAQHARKHGWPIITLRE